MQWHDFELPCIHWEFSVPGVAKAESASDPVNWQAACAPFGHALKVGGIDLVNRGVYEHIYCLHICHWLERGLANRD